VRQDLSVFTQGLACGTLLAARDRSFELLSLRFATLYLLEGLHDAHPFLAAFRFALVVSFFRIQFHGVLGDDGGQGSW
jgi:hypothetical protein